MELSAREVKRQLLALCLTVLSLAALFGHNRIFALVARGYADLAPGGFRVSYECRERPGHRLARHGARKATRHYPRGRIYPLMRRRQGWVARWEGVLTAPKTDEYAFYLQSVGPARLWIGEQLVIDHAAEQGWNPGAHARATLEQGPFPVRIEHEAPRGECAIRLRWTGGGVPPNTILGVPHVRKGETR